MARTKDGHRHQGVPPCTKYDEKLTGHDHLPARVRALFEETHHYGPWYSWEINAVFGSNRPARPPEPEPPADVKEARRAEELALVAFDEIDQRWQEAIATKRSIELNPPRQPYTRDYVPVRSQVIEDTRRRYREIEAALPRLKRERDRAWEVLTDARSDVKRAERAWELARQRGQA